MSSIPILSYARQQPAAGLSTMIVCLVEIILALALLDCLAKLCARNGTVAYNYGITAYEYKNGLRDYAATAYRRQYKIIQLISHAGIGGLAVLSIVLAFNLSLFTRRDRIIFLLAWVGVLGNCLVPFVCWSTIYSPT